MYPLNLRFLIFKNKENNNAYQIELLGRLNEIMHYIAVSGM